MRRVAEVARSRRTRPVAAGTALLQCLQQPRLPRPREQEQPAGTLLPRALTRRQVLPFPPRPLSGFPDPGSPGRG